MVRALRLAVLLAVVLAALPVCVNAAPLGVSFEVVRVTPTSATIRATITGATGPIEAQARVDSLERAQAAAPTVKAVQVTSVERVASYRDEPEYETKRIPIDEAMAALDAEIAALKNTKGLKSEEIDARREERHGKEAELEALAAEKLQGATHTEAQEVVAHKYTLETRERLALVAWSNVGDSILLPPQSWAEPPPSKLVSETELDLDPTLVNWGEHVAVYEYTISTGETQTADGAWGSAGILVLTINGQDYYDDTNSSWWDAAWPYRMKLTINNSASTENLVDFPLMVKLTPARFDYSFAQVDGDDIRFVDPDGTALDYEVDTWTLDGDSWFWVRVPQIDALSTTDYIWMYWGTPTVGSGENATGVWPVDVWAAVYHMNNKPGDATKILDSTANGNTGTKGAGAAAPTETAGPVGMAQLFDGGDYLDCGNGASLSVGAGNFSIVALMATTDVDAYSYIVSKRNPAGGAFYLLRLLSGKPSAYLRDTALAEAQVNASGSVADGATKTVAASVNKSSATGGKLFVNGAEVAYSTQNNVSALGSLDNAANLEIGRYQGGTYYLTATVHELRISSVAPEAEWMEADNLSMTDALLAYGDTEGMPEEVAEPPYPVTLAHAMLCVAVGLAAVRQRHIILYVAAFILLLFLALSLDSSTVPLMVMSFSTAGFMLYSATLWMFGRR
jgi:hypothetical protein